MKYIGVKVIQAEPMTLCEANAYFPPTQQFKHSEQDGYKVTYEDGYESWSPKSVFDAAYRSTTGMTFGLAIEAMKKGFKVARAGWNGKGIFIMLQIPDANSKMTHPYIYIDTTCLQTDNPMAPKNTVPWLASQTDMLSDDWQIIS